jgi:cholesterol 24-hydroxylase
MDTDSLNDKNNKLNSYITDVLNSIDALIYDPSIALNIFKGKFKNEFRQNVRKLREFAKQIVYDRMTKIENNEYIPNDILSLMLQNCNEDNVNLEQFVDEFVTFFLAGQETTANTLAFCFLEIGRNEQVLLK